MSWEGRELGGLCSRLISGSDAKSKSERRGRKLDASPALPQSLMKYKEQEV